MGTEIFFIAVILLAVFAFFDLIVGVSNDAVNFLNASYGSKVASPKTILVIAFIGLLLGVTFSGGMMEVARKGIFNPQYFTMPELMVVFLAVMLSDMLLLDTFNTYSLPTSTTVSIVFELLGASTAMALLKIIQAGDKFSSLINYINSSKALIIIFGILLSIAVAFICGAAIQFISRLIFTFDYKKRLKRYGGLWCGMMFALIVYFILVKGAKGNTLISVETAEWIHNNSLLLIGYIFIISSIIFQIMMFLKINILKLIILFGTMALAMSFAGNDLVNFIGVPLAGFHAYKIAMLSDNPLTIPMTALSQDVPSSTLILLLAGLIMGITLWRSKKSKGVTKTTVDLSSQGEEVERFESIGIARGIVGMSIGVMDIVKCVIPVQLRKWVNKRMDPTHFTSNIDEAKRSSFDLIRASVNLVAASAVISYATSKKLPLSTTYVTFMVAMGTSFADLAWGRESAVYRVTGVLTVVAGWFMTAFLAFSVSSIFVLIMFYGKIYAVIALLAFACSMIWINHHKFKKRFEKENKDLVFNLKKIDSVDESVKSTFLQMGYLLKEIRESLNSGMDALFSQNEHLLRIELGKSKNIQKWANIVIANIFKSMRLLQKEKVEFSHKYGQCIRGLQKLADGHRDIMSRSYAHIINHHKGLLDQQVEELTQVKHFLNEIIATVEKMLMDQHIDNLEEIRVKHEKLNELIIHFHSRQLDRICNGESKTRLSILYYDIMGNAIMISKQNLKLLNIFKDTFNK